MTNNLFDYGGEKPWSCTEKQPLLKEHVKMSLGFVILGLILMTVILGLILMGCVGVRPCQESADW